MVNWQTAGVWRAACTALALAVGSLTVCGHGPTMAQTAAPAPQQGQPEAANERLSGAQLRELLSGNSVWVLRNDMSEGDEYHLPDGRVFGFNGVENIVNSCWDIAGNDVCYYYKDDREKGRAHCWAFTQTSPGQFQIRATNSGMSGFAIMSRGNPRHHSDRGKPWLCEKLLSRRGGETAIAAR